jgi:hypothetical protein
VVSDCGGVLNGNMIDDPLALLSMGVWLFAAGMWPVAFLFGACSPCCQQDCPWLLEFDRCLYFDDLSTSPQTGGTARQSLRKFGGSGEVQYMAPGTGSLQIHHVQSQIRITVRISISASGASRTPVGETRTQVWRFNRATPTSPASTAYDVLGPAWHLEVELSVTGVATQPESGVTTSIGVDSEGQPKLFVVVNQWTATITLDEVVALFPVGLQRWGPGLAGTQSFRLTSSSLSATRVSGDNYSGWTVSKLTGLTITGRAIAVRLDGRVFLNEVHAVEFLNGDRSLTGTSAEFSVLPNNVLCDVAASRIGLGANIGAYPDSLTFTVSETYKNSFATWCGPDKFGMFRQTVCGTGWATKYNRFAAGGTIASAIAATFYGGSTLIWNLINGPHRTSAELTNGTASLEEEPVGEFDGTKFCPAGFDSAFTEFCAPLEVEISIPYLLESATVDSVGVRFGTGVDQLVLETTGVSESGQITVTCSKSANLTYLIPSTQALILFPQVEVTMIWVDDPVPANANDIMRGTQPGDQVGTLTLNAWGIVLNDTQGVAFVNTSAATGTIDDLCSEAGSSLIAASITSQSPTVPDGDATIFYADGRLFSATIVGPISGESKSLQGNLRSNLEVGPIEHSVDYIRAPRTPFEPPSQESLGSCEMTSVTIDELTASNNVSFVSAQAGNCYYARLAFRTAAQCSAGGFIQHSVPCDECTPEVTIVAGAEYARVTYIASGDKAGLIEIIALSTWLGGQGVTFTVTCGNDSITHTLRRADTVPEAPTNLTAVRDPCSTATLAWEAPHDGGQPITGYRVEYRPFNIGSYILFDTVPANSLSAVVTGLLRVGYQFRVAAINSVGTGAFSNIAVVDGFTLGAPTSLTFTRGPCDEVQLSWVAPTQSECVVVANYRMEYREGISGTFLAFGTVAGTQTTGTVNGLDPTLRYQFRVARVADAGGDLFSGTVTSGAIATTPFGVAATLGTDPGEVDVTWSANELLCFENTDYLVQFRPSTTSIWSDFTRAASTDKFATVTGLTPATYFFRVRATNSIGNSGFSAQSNSVTIPEPE